MIIKETDKKKYWCPFVQLNPANEDNINTVSNRSWKCVGSKCMAWRPVDSESGYCGLAGQPGAAINESRPVQQRQPAPAPAPQQTHDDYIQQNIPNKVGVQHANSPMGAPIDMNPKIPPSNNPNAPVDYDNAQHQRMSQDNMDIIKQMSGLK